MNNIDDESIRSQSWNRLLPESIAFLLFFLAFLTHWLIADGFAVNPDTQEIFMQPYKYALNLLEMPYVTGIFLVGVILVLWGIGKTYLNPSYREGIWFSGTGTVLTVLALLLCAGWNHTAYYPSISDLQSSLTLQNSCSSPFTLKVMSYVSILIPFVLAYIFYAWRAIDLKPGKKETEGTGL